MFKTYSIFYQPESVYFIYSLTDDFGKGVYKKPSILKMIKFKKLFFIWTDSWQL